MPPHDLVYGRRIASLTGDCKQIGVVDDIIRDALLEHVISTERLSSRIGYKGEHNVYVMLMHSIREASTEEYAIIIDHLTRLFRAKEFDGRFLANIIDERLRYTSHPDYPVYNFLR